MSKTASHLKSPSARMVLPLNGTWELEPGGRDVPPLEWAHRVPVPGLVDLATPTYDWNASEYQWYRASFDASTIPADRVVFLRLDQSRFGTAVWVNGSSAGEGIACYTAQEYRIDQVLKRDAPNELVIRVGARSTLPVESAVGNDQELSRFIPGIWGDVSLQVTGLVRIKSVQIIPHLQPRGIDAKVVVENLGTAPASIRLEGAVVSMEGERIAQVPSQQLTVAPGVQSLTVHCAMPNAALWAPDSPVLHVLDLTAAIGTEVSDGTSTRFGLREFRVDGKDFLLNGKKIRLRGSTIAFHRFLADLQRGTLPWDRAWIKRVLVDIPKEHHFNFFRVHLGQMYGAWYDVADECGILLQNEWPFWRTSGTKEQIVREWTDWITENANHPSIVIWDALNEWRDSLVEEEIIPQMKQLDPTRPWEPVDFEDQHSYVYSLGPVLNAQKFRFALGAEELEQLPGPLVVSEFMWWWLNPQNYPTLLMEGVVERWIGPNWTKAMLTTHQSFLMQELVECFRRMDAAAIQPFVYLSNGHGGAGNWFEGDIRTATPKPVLRALKNALAPVGVSIELWDRHFFPGEERQVRVFLFNDTNVEQRATLHLSIRSVEGLLFFSRSSTADIKPMDTVILPCDLQFPSAAGSYQVWAEVSAADPGLERSVSRKEAFVVGPPETRPKERAAAVYLFSHEGELRTFYESQGIRTLSWQTPYGRERAVVIADGRAVESGQYVETRDILGEFVRNGGRLVLIEPERAIMKSADILVLPDLELSIRHREDLDRGGYDSYVFPDHLGHSLWDELMSEHLRMFNGGLGGEAVSAHDVTVRAAHMVLARCGLGLRTLVAAEIPYGDGFVLMCRIQLRGRLVQELDEPSLFARRPDPVAQQIAMNFLSLG
jgi:hypothetical protein